MRILALLALFSPLAFSAEIRTVAGTGTQGFSGDGGPALAAQLDNPFGVTRGPDGCLWFCEYTGQRIRKILPDGRIQTVAGTGKKGFQATMVRRWKPASISRTKSGLIPKATSTSWTWPTT